MRERVLQLVVASIALLVAALDLYENPSSLAAQIALVLAAFCPFILACFNLCCPNQVPRYSWLYIYVPCAFVLIYIYRASSYLMQKP